MKTHSLISYAIEYLYELSHIFRLIDDAVEREATLEVLNEALGMELGEDDALKVLDMVAQALNARLS